ncbi:acetate--CoA ligase family protein [Leucobacter sp. CSA1]|uniref:Acetate--CoA ligase family protein n=1 Tax=Leucobacter chromiisoli TaxID=2796471 RepID=A0A934UU24_9MICO|nr:acetate--CoA ligase family protein [Leucobacter chromiisoli]MBK0419044.1 acetate--CoA ligase family protein [Leucobacter chromiisoli]
MARLREDIVREMVLAYGGSANVVRFCEDGTEAERIAADLGRAVAIKLVADDVIHKSKAGGVLLGIGPEHVRQRTDEMLARHRGLGSDVRGVTVEAMVDPGVEVVIGGLHTPGFGPVVMFGHGGVDIEELEDVAFAMAPLGEAEAEGLISRTRVGRALKKRLPDRVRDLVDTLLAIGGADGMLENENVTEVDLNPIVVSEGRVVAVDARAIERSGCDAPSEAPDPDDCYQGLRPAIYPRSVAVVGASADRSKMGYRVVSGLIEMGFQGRIVPVSRSSDRVCGLQAVASISELPEGIEKAVVVVPAAGVPTALDELSQQGIRAAHVYTSDIPPLDPELRERGMRVLGPNCMGHYAPRLGITMIAPESSSRTAGRIAVVSQSGTYAGDVVRRGSQLGLDFSFVSSVGNCDDVSPAELLAFCEADPETEVIAFYLEGDEGAEEFFRLAATTRKPVVLLKGGRTATGGAAAASHTGALAGDPQLLLDIAEQAGVLLVEDLDQLLDVLAMLQFAPGIRGDGLGIVGSGGGVAVVGADTADAWGLEVPRLGERASAALAPFAAPGASLANPVDIPVWSMFRGDECWTGAMVAGVALDDSIDAICAFIDVGTVFDIESAESGARLLKRLTEDMVRAETRGTPLALVLRSGFEEHQDLLVRDLARVARAAGVAVFDSVDRAIAAIGGARFLTLAGKKWATAGRSSAVAKEAA